MTKLMILKSTDQSTETQNAVVYVCSLCRFTFKVENQCEGVVCPGCNYLLRVDDLIPVLKTLGVDKKSLVEKQEASWDLVEEVEIKKQGESKLLLMVLVMSLISFCGFAYWLLTKQGPSDSVTKQEDVSFTQNPEAPKLTKQSSEEQLLESSISTLSALLEISSSKAIWPLVDASTYSKEEFDKALEKSPLDFKEYRVVGKPSMLEGLDVVETTVANGGERLQVYTYMKGGKAVIDWPSLVGYNKISEKLLQDEVVETIELRAVISEGDYFDFIFKDTDWICLKIVQPKKEFELPLYGYLKKDDVGSIKMLKEVLAGASRNALLSLSNLPQQAEKNRFIVNKLVAPNWFSNKKIKKDE